MGRNSIQDQATPFFPEIRPIFRGVSRELRALDWVIESRDASVMKLALYEA
jgi:hypothetical protein